VDSTYKLTPIPDGDTAESLREQAAACRRLSLQSRTKAGAKALNTLGDHFDDRADRLGPLGING